jgi:proteasome lid subunit RPN8/RPN11
MDAANHLSIPLVVWQAMHDEVVRWAPEEACGLLAGQSCGQVERAMPVTNRLHSPSRFEMEPREQLRAFLDIEAAGSVLCAIYHSHPAGPDHPSPTDLVEFAYPGVIYLIWAPEQPGAAPLWNARAFIIDKDDFQEIFLQLV